MGEAFLSAVVETLVNKLTSSESKDFLKKRKLNTSLLNELKIKLLALKVALNDAKTK